jgi:hypothetical protein
VKEYTFGRTKVRVHSNLLDVTKEERRQWYREEMAKGNPILKEIAKAVNDCYRKVD